MSGVLIVGAALSGCADLPPTDATAARYEMETPIGSNISRKARKTDKNTQLSQAEQDELRRQATIANPTITPVSR